MKLASRLAAALSVLMAGTAAASPVHTQELDQALLAKPDPAHGARLFETCAPCHGNTGAGTGNGQIPRIAGQYFEVLVRQLVDFRHGKRWDIRMEQIAGSHQLDGAQNIADVAGYISRLPVPSHPGAGSGELVGHGARVYALLCQSCHGPAGEGIAADGVPQIAAQHYEYLLRQMHDAIEGRRPDFPPVHVKLLSGLNRDDLVGVADYLSRLASTDQDSQLESTHQPQ